MRAPGVRLDPGGIAKGMAADLAAAALPPGVRYAISCGGDVAVGGGEPWQVAVRSARSDAEVHRLRVRSGGVATSGIAARIWKRPDGSYAHHVLDPATGRPAWTGLVAATRRRGQRARGRGAREDRAAVRAARCAAAAAPPRRRAPARRRPRGGGPGARRRAAPAARAPARRRVSTDPFDYPFWLASRSAGVVAYLLLSASVVLGLVMAARLAPVTARSGLRVLHERVALLALGAVAAHGLFLLPDRWLHPGLHELLIPFTTGYRPVWTGLGICAAYLAAGLSLSYYARRRLGSRRWRTAHRLIPVAWALAAVHVISAPAWGLTCRTN